MTMSKPRRYLAVTNNSLVISGKDLPVDIAPVEGDALAVLTEAEDLLTREYSLVSAPLPPNVPMMRCRWRSLLLRASEGGTDVEGLRMIGRARERLTLQAHTPGGLASDDYAALDREYLERGLRDLSILEGLEEPV
ncbi:MAG: GrdX family protein [Synergistaceae bacterium]|nr:GrdX family protein [Synergistaceae bacterium]